MYFHLVDQRYRLGRLPEKLRRACPPQLTVSLAHGRQFSKSVLSGDSELLLAGFELLVTGLY
jgi:hypothetical protein